MNMKDYLRISAILLSIALGVACKKPTAGIYVSQDDPGKYLELKRDGSFYLGTMREGLSGRYEVDGQLISLRFEGGRTLRGRLERDTFVEYGGSTYARRSAPPPASTAENEAAAVFSLRTIHTAEAV